ncbi:MAG: hypothetical protein COT67_02590 [Candidatus Tagabacteria bacterium CG09_land_8_20_14_0_10_41_14]|uniref:Uncharacterized protein n=2 Tax=Candidatus Tagaibacteriota TaxID=1817918 RepID=A0A2H0WKT2_9BACT|nr:MAG: hypothetical protein COT67_02590 [Candidatus Tagabacteria bacterium CG09_land_8_20_14_0_10_41_14]PJE72983.1 MAG: hypothetical protein COV00_02195 [Candidatus Tagabacteria bacterium CG10_big_fil_rev_8_21_14_0_10_40_13]
MENITIEENIEVSEGSVVSDNERSSGGADKWKTVSRYFLMAMVLLLPLWLIPIGVFTLAFSKSFLIFVLTLAALIFYLTYLLQEGKIKYLRGFILLALLGIVVVTLVSSLFSATPSVSLLGSGAETTSFFSILILSVLFFLTFSLFRSQEKMLKLLFLLFFSASLVFVCQFLRVVFGLTFFNLLPSTFSNFVGSWSELAIFFGLIALISVVFLQFFGSRMLQLHRGKFWRLFLIFISVASLLVMFLVNFTAAWIVFGFFMLLFLVSLFTSYGERRVFAKLPLFLILLSLLFILAGNLIGDLASGLNLNFLEVRPSWGATIDVAKNTWSSGIKNLLVGSGPGTFGYDWLKFKPEGINQTIFWNLRFDYGIGVIPSLLSTVGVLGGFVWLVFLLALVYYGIRSIGYKGDEITKSLFFSLFLGSVYLWTFNVIYSTSNFLFALSFIVTGLFFAILAKIGRVALAEFSFLKRPIAGFVSSLSIVLLLILTAVSFYLVFQKSWAAYSYGKGVEVLNQEGDLAKAEVYLKRAIRYDEQGRYYRALGDLDLLNLSVLVNQQQQFSQEELSARFQAFLASAVQNMQTAIRVNPQDPANWQSLGRVYESVIPYQVQGARDAAVDAYKEALKRSPSDPQIYLNLARVEVQAGNNKEAIDYLSSALNLKSNYTLALFLAAQIAAQEGDLDSAIQRTEMARLTAPNDIGVLFQLGLLYYQKEDYGSAILALKRAVSVNENYSNALYFLGLAYDKKGEKRAAVEQFEKVGALNPDNEEIKTILSNLKAGKPALSSISPPELPPEEREDLPVEEIEE